MFIRISISFPISAVRTPSLEVPQAKAKSAPKASAKGKAKAQVKAKAKAGHGGVRTILTT